jgi:hypothetical protein
MSEQNALEEYQRAEKDNAQVKQWLKEIEANDRDTYMRLVEDPRFELLERKNMQHPDRSKAVGWLMNEYNNFKHDRQPTGFFSSIRSVLEGSRR